jgi:hypothetical protein
MGALTSEVGYTSATTRRGDHEIYMGMWWHWKKRSSFTNLSIPCCQCPSVTRTTSHTVADFCSHVWVAPEQTVSWCYQLRFCFEIILEYCTKCTLFPSILHEMYSIPSNIAILIPHSNPHESWNTSFKHEYGCKWIFWFCQLTDFVTLFQFESSIKVLNI